MGRMSGPKATAKAAPKIEDFQHLDTLGITLPKLALALELNPRDEYAVSYRFKAGRTWRQIVHRTAGARGHHRYLYVSFLTPKAPEVFAGIDFIARKWLGSQAGCLGVSLDRAVEYREDLRKHLRADCNVSHHGFEEGFYPIDLPFAAQLVADNLPADLDDLIKWRTSFEQSAGSVGRWKLVILGPSS